jgi:hypothetical protein
MICGRAGSGGHLPAVGPPVPGGGDGRDHGLKPDHHHDVVHHHDAPVVVDDHFNAPLAANSAGMVRRLSSGGHCNVTMAAGGNGVLRGRQYAPVHLGRALRRDQRQADTDPARLPRGPGAGREHRPQVHRDRHGRQAGLRHLGPTSRDATASSGATRGPASSSPSRPPTTAPRASTAGPRRSTGSSYGLDRARWLAARS